MSRFSEKNLFRKEAVMHASGSLYGTILLSRPLSYGMLTVFFTLMSSAVIAFLILFSYTSSTVVPGLLVPNGGTVRVVAARPGTVSQVMVKEGSQVKSGDVLFVLTNEFSTLDNLESEQAIVDLIGKRRTSYERELTEYRQQNLQHIAFGERRILELNSELTHIDEQISLQRRRIEISNDAVERHTELHSANFISSAYVEDKLGALLDQQQRLGDMERSRIKLRADIETEKEKISNIQFQLKLGNESISRNIDSLTQDLAEVSTRRQLAVRATQSGTVTAITAHLGQAVTASQALATIFPSSSTLEVELYASSKTVGFITTKMPVRIRFHAYPFQTYGQYGGTVTEVTNTALTAGELNPAAISAINVNPGGAYRVRVLLDRQSVKIKGEEHLLRSGTTLEATIPLEKRRLYEWVLGPAFAKLKKF